MVTQSTAHSRLRRVAPVGGLASGPLQSGSPRSEDAFNPVGERFTDPHSPALSSGGDMAFALAIVALSFALGIVLALLTYALGDLIATRIVWPTPPMPPVAPATKT